MRRLGGPRQPKRPRVPSAKIANPKRTETTKAIFANLKRLRRGLGRV